VENGSPSQFPVYHIFSQGSRPHGGFVEPSETAPGIIDRSGMADGPGDGIMTTFGAVGRSSILFCTCAHYEIIPPAAKERILTALSQTGQEIEAVGDLCGLAAHRDPRLQRWAAAPQLVVVACFPRAVRWLFHAAGATLSQEKVRCLNMRTQTPEEIIASIADCGLGIADSSSGANPQSAIRNPHSDWVPWFPVIDYDRCKNCKQCLNFCLFGVYQLSQEGKVQVRNPAGCKTNCPACARMCPQKAIIFPKYGEAPINGDEVPAAAGPCAGPDAGQPGDLYERIRRRESGRKRFATQTPEASPARSCPTLEGLRRELGIPDEVLTSLSPAELERVMARKNPPPSSSDAGSADGGKDKERHG
jgi:NAD-dependent dihydropyrimidine dehydrogenase PreA subunit